MGRGRLDRAAAKTDPGSPLLSLASFAATAAGKTPNAEAVRTPLDALLRQIELGKDIHEADARMAALVALHMARATRDAGWLEYAFRLYSALRLPLPAELIDRLGEALNQLGVPTTPAFATYLELLQRQDSAAWDETERQLIARLAALHNRA